MHERVNHYRELKQLIETHPCQPDLPEETIQHLDEMITWSELAIKKFSELFEEWEDYFKRR